VVVVVEDIPNVVIVVAKPTVLAVDVEVVANVAFAVVVANVGSVVEAVPFANAATSVVVVVVEIEHFDLEVDCTIEAAPLIVVVADDDPVVVRIG